MATIRPTLGNAASPLQQLRRISCAALLWEESSNNGLGPLVAKCDPLEVAKLALEIRTNQGLRKMPLALLRELVRRPEARKIVGEYLPQVIQRADEPAAFLSMYWDAGKTPVAHQVKKGLGLAMAKFDAYQFGKYKGHGDAVSLRDVAHLVHAKPEAGTRQVPLRKGDRKGWTEDVAKAQLSPREFLYWQLSNDCLPVPETRETMLSGSGSDAEKKAGFESMIANRKLGSSALLKSLALMEKVGVSEEMIQLALSQARPDRLLPLNFLSAAKASPAFVPELTALMKRCMMKFTQLAGTTVFVLDTSGSMNQPVAAKTEFNRMQAAGALGIMAQSVCENSIVYLTAGSDGSRTHATARISETLDLGMDIGRLASKYKLGGGGIFTRQALEFIEADMKKRQEATPDRIIVLSDSADCDHAARRKPAPFGKYNYIADISTNTHSVNYDGVWTAEISGWSQAMIEYIAQLEVGYQESLF